MMKTVTKLNNCMRALCIIILSFCLGCNYIPEQGFTNKAEAKNEIINHYKEGKWFEYRDSSFHVTEDTNAPFYSLITYKTGKIDGVLRFYYKSGKLFKEAPYSDGKVNGISKVYYEDGKLKGEVFLKDDKEVGVGNFFYESGQLRAKTPYTDDKKNGVEKWYYPNGNIKRELAYKR